MPRKRNDKKGTHENHQNTIKSKFEGNLYTNQYTK